MRNKHKTVELWNVRFSSILLFLVPTTEQVALRLQKMRSMIDICLRNLLKSSDQISIDDLNELYENSNEFICNLTPLARRLSLWKPASDISSSFVISSKQISNRWSCCFSLSCEHRTLVVVVVFFWTDLKMYSSRTYCQFWSQTNLLIILTWKKERYNKFRDYS